MADSTKIEWTDATWNPIRGCSMAKGSELGGCLNCYAAREAVRYTGEGMPYEGLARMTANGPRWTGRIRVLDDADHLLHPLRWQRPRLVFVNSMSDLFHETLPFDVVDKIVAVMAVGKRHTFQVLTKRPERMAAYLNDPGRRVKVLEAVRALDLVNPATSSTWWPLPNVWWGVSCEDDRTLAARMPYVIRALPNMAVAWLSAEPLLGPLNGLHTWLPHERDTSQTRTEWYPGLSWVVAGGESGPGARPMNPDWARGIRDSCRAAGVPFLFKQWGAWRPPVPGEAYDTLPGRAGNPPAFLVAMDGTVHCTDAAAGADALAMLQVGKKAAGRLLDGETWDQYPAGAGKGRVS